MIKKILREFKQLFIWLLVRLISRFYKVRKNKIVFTNFSGDYECNTKYICEEILRRELPYEIVWVVQTKGPKKNIISSERYPSCLTLTERGSYEFYRHLFTAHVIIDNGTSFAAADYKKKRNQILINTWHGSLGFKRFPKNTTLWNWRYNRKALRMGRMVDYMISNSDFEDSYYRESYFAHTPILRLGHARNDLLLERDTERLRNIQKKVRANLGIDDSKRICLYAPTFRDDNDIGQYELPYDEIPQALKERFGGDWVVLTRFHHRVKERISALTIPRSVISASDYPDIVELMVCADVGITDYSSWICEFIHTHRPAFLFATDMEDFDQERGFYDPLDKMPFPYATDAAKLIEEIRMFDETRYLKDCAEFLQRKGCREDGHACERIADFIAECMTRSI